MDPTFQAPVNRLGWFVLPKYEDDDDAVSLDGGEGDGDEDALGTTGAGLSKG